MSSKQAPGRVHDSTRKPLAMTLKPVKSNGSRLTFVWPTISDCRSQNLHSVSKTIGICEAVNNVMSSKYWRNIFRRSKVAAIIYTSVTKRLDAFVSTETDERDTINHQAFVSGWRWCLAHMLISCPLNRLILICRVPGWLTTAEMYVALKCRQS